MHKTATDYALRHQISLGRYGEGYGARSGYYFVRLDTGAELVSMTPTARSAINVMKKYLRMSSRD